MADASTFNDVKAVVVETLGIEPRRAASLDGSTPLLGSMPELDSMAVVELVTTLEDRFGFEVDHADVTGDVFESLGSLADYVENHRT